MSPPKANYHSAEAKLNLVTEALATEPRNWTKEHVQVLPKQFLLRNISTFTLMKIWDDLPETIKTDEEIQQNLPCLEHYNRDEDSVHIDGPPPSKLRCRSCIRERILEKERKANNSNSRSNGFIDNNGGGVVRLKGT